jgi:hypothetical protein
MSVFIKIERFAAQPRLYRIRSLSCIVGEDRQGVFTIDQPEQPFFEFFAIGDRYLIRAKTSGFSIDGQAWPVEEDRWLNRELFVKGCDYTFSFFVTSSEAEIVGSNPTVIEQLIGSDSRDRYPSATIALAGAFKSVVLFVGVLFSVGSSPQDTIIIDLPEVVPAHFYLSYNGDSVEIRPGRGTVTVQGRKVTEPISFKLDFSVVLEPVGFKVRIDFPKT